MLFEGAFGAPFLIRRIGGPAAGLLFWPATRSCAYLNHHRI